MRSYQEKQRFIYKCVAPTAKEEYFRFGHENGSLGFDSGRGLGGI